MQAYDVFTLFPNPLSGNEPFFIHLERDPPDLCIVEIYHLDGRIVYRKAFYHPADVMEIHDAHLSDALYIVGVCVEGDVYFSKLLNRL